VRAVFVIAALLIGFGVVTLVALEGGEVVVLRTGSGDDAHETRAWITEADGEWWIGLLAHTHASRAVRLECRAA